MKRNYTDYYLNKKKHWEDDERIGMKNPIGLGDDIKKWSKMINPTEVLHDET